MNVFLEIWMVVLLFSICVCVNILSIAPSARGILQHNSSVIVAICYFNGSDIWPLKMDFGTNKENQFIIMAKASLYVPELLSAHDLGTCKLSNACLNPSHGRDGGTGWSSNPNHYAILKP